jgi:hypothetical protein
MQKYRKQFKEFLNKLAEKYAFGLYKTIDNREKFVVSIICPEKEVEELLEYISKHYLYKKYKSVMAIKDILE